NPGGSAPAGSAPAGRPAAVELLDVSRRFGGLTALRAVNLELSRPGLVALVGVNGSGKTTLLRTLVGLLRPTSGTVRVGGVDPWRFPDRAHRFVGYVPEAPRPYPGMTVEAYLTFAARLARPRGERRAAISRAVESFGLEGVRRQRCGGLSLGFRQRVALAQLDIVDPAVLVLDEPMNGLDPRQMQQLRDRLRTWTKDRTVLLSSHLVTEVADLADEVLFLHAGRLIARFASAAEPVGDGARLWAAAEAAPEPGDVVLRPAPGRTVVVRWAEVQPGPGWREVGERSARTALEDLFLASLTLAEGPLS
ncbi:MAG TPA: ABC transporter ATP-binding protein, partial [Acidimicrobiia bacterium]|nr:ABC transporter ATP-binding protein [Acidimicrobiia bacterium]